MATNFVQSGEAVTFINSGVTDIASGSLVVMANLVGIAAGLVKAGESGVLYLSGVYTLPKTAHATDQAIVAGGAVIWDASAAKCVNAATTPAEGDAAGWGVAIEAAASTATTVKVRLTGAVATITPAAGG